MVEIVDQSKDMKKTKAPAQKKAGRDTWSKKSWYGVLSPKVFGENVVGEVPALKSTNLIGRIIKISLSDITKNYKHMHKTAKLKITKVEDKHAKTEYVGQDLLKDALARLIRRWSSRIDSVQDIQLKGKKMRLKMVVITARKANSSVQSEIRALVVKTAEDFLGGKAVDDVVVDLNNEKLTRMIHNSASKIFPIRAVDVRKVEVK